MCGDLCPWCCPAHWSPAPAQRWALGGMRPHPEPAWGSQRGCGLCDRAPSCLGTGLLLRPWVLWGPGTRLDAPEVLPEAALS